MVFKFDLNRNFYFNRQLLKQILLKEKYVLCQNMNKVHRVNKILVLFASYFFFVALIVKDIQINTSITSLNQDTIFFY